MSRCSRRRVQVITCRDVDGEVIRAGLVCGIVTVAIFGGLLAWGASL